MFSGLLQQGEHNIFLQAYSPKWQDHFIIFSFLLSFKIKPFEVDVQHENSKHGYLKAWQNYKQIGKQDLISWTVGQSFVIAGTTNPTSSNPHPEANCFQTPAWQHNSAHLHSHLASADAETEADWQQDNSGENYIFYITFIRDYI